MKIKSDFITNSSSTSFIVCIPNNFHFTLESLNEYPHIIDVDYDEEYDDETYMTKVLEDLNLTLDELKQGRVVWFENDDIKSDVISLLEMILPEKYKIYSFDSGSNDGKIINIDIDKVSEIIEEISNENQK